MTAPWLQTVQIGDLHTQFRAGSLTIQQVAAWLADRLEPTAAGDWLRDDGVLETLRDIGSIHEYDEILEHVYEVADKTQVRLDPDDRYSFEKEGEE